MQTDSIEVTFASEGGSADRITSCGGQWWWTGGGGQ